MKTNAPSLTKSFAAANPIPVVPPVMTATFPCNLPIRRFPFRGRWKNARGGFGRPSRRVWRLDFEPECRPVALHVSSCRRGIMGADDQDRLVGPFGEQLRAGGRCGLGVA